MRLKGKIILITGGYTGIGKAIAQRCVQEGARLAVNGLEEEAAAALVAELGPKNVLPLTLDITERDAPLKMVSHTVLRYDKLDAVVNNAAYIAQSNITDTNLAFMQRMMSVNAFAPLMIIQAALPYLKQVGGSVLNIGSINAWGGEPDLLAYSMSKGALMTLTRNLGDCLFRDYGVRVNQVNPGWVLTEKEILNKKEQGMQADWYKDIPNIFAPAQRIFSPEEIAAACLYWLSDECGPVSAQVMDLEQYPIVGRNLPKNWEGSHT